MDYPKFMELSSEMKVQIIKKCYPIPYVRLRQSCRYLDEFSEKNGRKLGIYCYRDEPHLYLTNTLSIEPFSAGKVANIDGPHVVVNYGKYAYSHNFLMPMTSRNISKIRSSLSGFYFFEITLANFAPVEDYKENKKFDDALKYFLEMSCDLNFCYVDVKNLTTEQIEIVLSEWNPRGITAHSYRETNAQNFKKIAQMEAVKKMPYADYYTSHQLTGITSKLIEELARDKETISLLFNGLSSQIAQEGYNNLLIEIWAKKAKLPRHFFLYFIDGLHVFDHPYEITSQTHISQIMCLQLNFTELEQRKKKYDVWLTKEAGKNTWRMITIARKKVGNKTQLILCLRNTVSTGDLIEKLLMYLDTSYRGHARDYSAVYEKLKNARTAEEIKEEYTKLTEEMLRFYKKTYRRSILNVLCEMMTEWWNWPRWILEFTKRRPIEKRPPIVDLGYVLFQEILCPIYQYSTMPYCL